jgi:hypothetical protein
MRKRFRTRPAILLMLVSCTWLKLACQAALLPSVLLYAVLHSNPSYKISVLYC